MCYAVSTAATLVLWATGKVKKIKSPQFERLNLMLLGGSIMLIVDHWWRGELFLIGKDITRDLLLGVAMTGAIFAVWAILAYREKKLLLEKNG